MVRLDCRNPLDGPAAMFVTREGFNLRRQRAGCEAAEPLSLIGRHGRVSLIGLIDLVGHDGCPDDIETVGDLPIWEPDPLADITMGRVDVSREVHATWLPSLKAGTSTSASA